MKVLDLHEAAQEKGDASEDSGPRPYRSLPKRLQSMSDSERRRIIRNELANFGKEGR